jgi:hypothetical protein
MFQTKLLKEIKTHFMFNASFSENRAVYEIMGGKYCKAGDATDDNRTRLMRIACWIREATDAYLEYLIFIALSLQQWLHERASTLRYTYDVCLVLQYFHFQSAVTPYSSTPWTDRIGPL